jgi:hypothetical protein
MESTSYESVRIERQNGGAAGSRDTGPSLDMYTFIRGSLITVILTVVMLNSIYGFALPQGNVECILDKSFIYTEGINTYLKHNSYARHLLLIISSLFVDVIITVSFFTWVFYGKSWRLLISLLVFYTFRSLVQVS